MGRNIVTFYKSRLEPQVHWPCTWPDVTQIKGYGALLMSIGRKDFGLMYIA